MNIIKQIFNFYPELWLALISLILSLLGLPLIGMYFGMSVIVVILIRLIVGLISSIKKKK